MVYCWGAFGEKELIEVLKKEGIEPVVYANKMSDYHKDMVVAQEIIALLHSRKPEGIISYNYFPLLSMIGEMNGLPYLSWIYDCPHYTLLSHTLLNECNHIFCFDYAFCQELEAKGARHVVHFPLGVSVAAMEERIAGMERGRRKQYAHEIAFVGSFYNDKENRLHHKRPSEKTRGYLDGVMEAQLMIYGSNFISRVLPEEVIREMEEVYSLKLGEAYLPGVRDLAAGMVNKEITARERERILAAVAANYKLHVYTGSQIPDRMAEEEFVNMGYADTVKEMPVIFQESKINLNITLRSITTGIPQRVLDILACGGFLITNYQPETAACFEDGEELVMYSSIKELLEKIDYYLMHEKERKTIAKKGKEKVKQFFDLPIRVREMLNLMKRENG